MSFWRENSNVIEISPKNRLLCNFRVFQSIQTQFGQWILQRPSLGSGFPIGPFWAVEFQNWVLKKFHLFRGQTYTNQMNAVLGMKPQMMMVVIPNNKSDLYSITKKLCCIQNPCPTQVMTGSLLKKGKGLGSIALKVAIQMACKLGAEPWIVKLPTIAGLMIIGKWNIIQYVEI